MSSILHPNALEDYLDEHFSHINCTKETRAYIKGIFIDYLKSNKDLSKNSITIFYYKAKLNYNFAMFQQLGDWLFWVKSIYPEHLSDASPDFYNSIAQNSYYKCHLILNKQWHLYAELADRFPYFTESFQELIAPSK